MLEGVFLFLYCFRSQGRRAHFKGREEAECVRLKVRRELP